MQMLKHRRHTRPPTAPTGPRSAVPQRRDDGTWAGRSGTSWMYAMPDLASPLWQQSEHRDTHAQTLKSLLGSVAERSPPAPSSGCTCWQWPKTTPTQPLRHQDRRCLCRTCREGELRCG